MTKMLKALDLPTLQQRRNGLRLTFLSKIVEEVVPAIPAEKYSLPIKKKRKISAKIVEGFCLFLVTKPFANQLWLDKSVIRARVEHRPNST